MTEDDFLFRWEDKSIIRFAWRPKWIIDSMKQLYWDKEWIEIYQKFLDWLANIANISPFKWNTGVLVLYPNSSDNDIEKS